MTSLALLTKYKKLSESIKLNTNEESAKKFIKEIVDLSGKVAEISKSTGPSSSTVSTEQSASAVPILKSNSAIQSASAGPIVPSSSAEQSASAVPTVQLSSTVTSTTLQVTDYNEIRKKMIEHATNLVKDVIEPVKGYTVDDYNLSTKETLPDYIKNAFLLLFYRSFELKENNVALTDPANFYKVKQYFDKNRNKTEINKDNYTKIDYSIVFPEYIKKINDEIVKNLNSFIKLVGFYDNIKSNIQKEYEADKSSETGQKIKEVFIQEKKVRKHVERTDILYICNIKEIDTLINNTYFILNKTILYLKFLLETTNIILIRKYNLFRKMIDLNSFKQTMELRKDKDKKDEERKEYYSEMSKRSKQTQSIRREYNTLSRYEQLDKKLEYQKRFDAVEPALSLKKLEDLKFKLSDAEKHGDKGKEYDERIAAVKEKIDKNKAYIKLSEDAAKVKANEYATLSPEAAEAKYNEDVKEFKEYEKKITYEINDELKKYSDIFYRNIKHETKVVVDSIIETQNNIDKLFNPVDLTKFFISKNIDKSKYNPLYQQKLNKYLLIDKRDTIYKKLLIKPFNYDDITPDTTDIFSISMLYFLIEKNILYKNPLFKSTIDEYTKFYDGSILDNTSSTMPSRIMEIFIRLYYITGECNTLENLDIDDKIKNNLKFITNEVLRTFLMTKESQARIGYNITNGTTKEMNYKPYNNYFTRKGGFSIKKTRKNKKLKLTLQRH